MGPGIFISVQTGRNDAGIVKYQQITGTKILRQIIKMPVLHGAGIFIYHQQPAMIPGFHRMLGNPFFRQKIIKISNFHNGSLFIIQNEDQTCSCNFLIRCH